MPGLFKRLFGRKPPAARMGSAEANSGVRAVLAAHGDDGSQIRHVVHYVYPEKRGEISPREEIHAYLVDLGFEVRDAAQGDGFVFEHHREVAQGDFDAFTTGLQEDLAARGWEYDGWECAVSAAE